MTIIIITGFIAAVIEFYYQLASSDVANSSYFKIIITNIMNAQECKTLTATRMHDSCTCRSIVVS